MTKKDLSTKNISWEKTNCDKNITTTTISLDYTHSLYINYQTT
jgi:hypothetical protein